MVNGTRVSPWRIILDAYQLRSYQLSGGPAWLDSDKFDIECKAATAADEDQLRQMLRTLLAERFHLEVHRSSREMPVYFLTVGKNGPKMLEVKPGEPMPQAPGDGQPKHLFFRMNVQGFADLLSNDVNVGRPVLDRTGLPGVYLFFFGWDADEDFIPMMQERTGLKLESQKAVVDTLIVDRIEKPSEN
jgi:uncharacterized protein (TIGR03435 family)